jgi:hypothetical protein
MITIVITDILRKIHRSRFTGQSMRLVSRQFGTNIFEKDWDVLLIFDAASFEMMRGIYDEYDFIEDYGSMWSRGSSSPEWAQNTFIEDEPDLDDVHYVSANTLTSLVTSGIHEKEIYRTDDIGAEPWMIEHYKNEGESIFESSHPVWLNQYGEKDSAELFFIDPDIVTSEALDVMDEYDGNFIIHYMQPHEPFVRAEDPRYDMWPYDKDYSMFNMDNKDYESLIKAYRDNHTYILEKIENFLVNIDDELEVCITADHANMYGRVFDVPYAFGHPQYIWFNRTIRKVPYMKVNQSIVDKETDLNVEKEGTVESDEVVDRLEALGYK